MAKDAILVLWVPSSKLQVGMDCMKAWGFDQKQTWIWVKTKKAPIYSVIKSSLRKLVINKSLSIKELLVSFKQLLNDFDLNDSLAFGMGRLFRQTHEIALVGTRGKIYNLLQNKSQRSVYFWPATKHSEKPEGLQDMLDLMFPDKTLNRVEMFSRRDRPGWICLGNECPSTFGEDIRDSIKRLKNNESSTT